MKIFSKSNSTAAFIATALLSTGCQSLPWTGKRDDQPVTTADEYVEQAAANIQYDTSVDPSAAVDTDCQSLAPHPSFAAPSLASPQSSAGGGCCH